MPDPSRNGYEATFEAVNRVLDAETAPVRIVAGVVKVAADDAAAAWASLAGDLARVIPLAPQHRWTLNRAKARAEQMARLARKLRADVDKIMEAES